MKMEALGRMWQTGYCFILSLTHFHPFINEMKVGRQLLLLSSGFFVFFYKCFLIMDNFIPFTLGF